MHELRRQIGPVRFRLLSDWRTPFADLTRLYAAYPEPDCCDFTVRLEAPNTLRRIVRPHIRLGGDYAVAEAAPLPLRHGLLAAEMAMNLHVALGWRRHLVIHASSAEKDGRVLVMTGQSGSGKSTLSAMLGENGWRFMGDEFALLDPVTGQIHPFPRLVSLKNEAIGVMERIAPESRFGPRLTATPKGDIRHFVPPADAIARMTESAPPALILYPRFGHALEVRPLGLEENFVRLTQASTNYVALGEAGFEALTRFVHAVPALALDFDDGEAAMATVERLWDEKAVL